MGMIIRVAFNNSNWSGKCKNADRDRRLIKCKKEIFDTRYQIDKDGNCLGDCWESELCKSFTWHRVKGNFNVEKAKGNVFFIFPDIDNSFVLFASSKILEVSDKTIKFKKFKPLPPEKWKTGLSSYDLIHTSWGQGTYRYLDKNLEDSIIELMQTGEEYFDDPIEPEITDVEGKKLLRKHLERERSSKLVRLFKKSLTSFDCKICGFNFERKYGEKGANFIEAHHIKPVASLSGNEPVSIKDLIPVCSNCHRIIHRSNPPANWQDLLPE